LNEGTKEKIYCSVTIANSKAGIRQYKATLPSALISMGAQRGTAALILHTSSYRVSTELLSPLAGS